MCRNKYISAKLDFLARSFFIFCSPFSSADDPHMQLLQLTRTLRLLYCLLLGLFLDFLLSAFRQSTLAKVEASAERRTLPKECKNCLFKAPLSQTKSTKLILEPKAISVKLDAVQSLLSTENYLLKCLIFLCKLVLWIHT